ncbi:MAG TPA: isopenicillin N synthase family oxygenase [Gammaproteobacteria bacterium]|nr:isopenicillin N synthase family oxygenase [Gammaproteobacteria bacterium]HIM99311.1 isopenicillin N synthase family oxygenase [Gammaproteobacteria bacterium]
MAETSKKFEPSEYGKQSALRIEAEAASWRQTTQRMMAPPLATPEQVPILDLSDVRAGREGALQDFTEKLRTSAFETGFFLLKGHGVPPELEDAVHYQGSRFKDLSEEIKMCYGQNANGVGYVPRNIRRQPRRSKGNMCECIYFKREYGPRDIGWDKNLWPIELGPEFRETVIEYLESMERMAKLLLPAYAALFEVAPDFFAPAFDGGLIRSRLAYYPHVELEEDQFGVSPHVDTTFLTILSRRESTPGLCAATVDDQWVTIPNLPGHFTVNTGELLKSWSNNKIVSTRHYANAVASERYSIPFFWHPRADYVMDCRSFPIFCNDRDPPQYPPFNYLESQGPAQGE